MAGWWRVAGGGVEGILRAIETPEPAWRRCSSAGYHQIIQAVPREATGSRAATKERLQGRIPSAVLSFGGVGSVHPASQKLILTTDSKQIGRLLNQSPFFWSTRIDLQVRAGVGSVALIQSGTVLPLKVNRDKETGEILDLVMAWAENGTELKVNVPVVFKGEDVCPGLKKGGYLHKINTGLRYLCPAEHIPQKIEVDIAKLDIGDKITTNDLRIHPSLKLVGEDVTVLPICEILATKPSEIETEHESRYGVMINDSEA